MTARGLAAIEPLAFAAARQQAHWAAQLVAAAGETYLVHVPDTSHTAMTWEAALGGFGGGELPAVAGDALRLGYGLAELRLVLFGGGGRPRAELALAGHSVADACAWVAAAVKQHSGGALDRPLVHPGYELEPPLRPESARFEPGHAAVLAELARWYASADAELRRIARETPGAGPVLCWPHHFDLATLIELERDAAGDALRSAGVGLSPGDAFIAQPYWYVNHGPPTARAPRELPRLAAGEWFTDGWTGAILRADALVAAGDAAAQQRRLRAYLDSAVAASLELAREAPLD